MSDRIERMMSATLTFAVVVMAVAIAYRTFAPREFQLGGGGVALSLDSISSWEDALPIGFREGRPDAPVTLVELGDLECPACRDFQSTLATIRRKYSKQLALIFVNFPLSQHRFAMGAARAGVCAAQVGKFSQWRDVVFSGQDSLGLKSWGEYALSAGISDTTAIAKCARNAAPVPEIEDGLKFGTRIGLAGTPTVILNGWRFSGTPTQGELEAAIEAELKGNRPPHATAVVGQK